MPGPSGLPIFKILAGRYDFTYEAENLTFSSVDPGGYEIASFDLQSERAELLNPGDNVEIWDGLLCIWKGRIAEPAKTIKHGVHFFRKIGSQSTRVGCEGAGSGFKDSHYSMIYIDRNLGRWQSWSINRQINLVPTPLNISSWSWQIGPDTSGLIPGLIFTITGAWSGRPVSEAWFDAGPLNLVTRIRGNGRLINFSPASTDVNVTGGISTSNNDVKSVFSNSANVFATLSNPAFDFTLTPLRYAVIQTLYNTTAAAGIAGLSYGMIFYNLSVIGNHGLTLRGTSPNDGFYVSDIAAHAASMAQANGLNIKIGQVDTVGGYTVLHYSQYSPVDYEQVLSDMAQIGPAHYGTWENSSIFDDRPEFVFRAYGTQATAYCSLADADEVDVSERLSNLYTSALITYSDAAGVQFVTRVTLPNYILNRAGVTREVQLNLGLSSSGAAQVFANYALQALFAQARVAGSVQLPRKIRDANGAPLPSYRLKPGIDRLRVTDLSARTGLFTGSDTDSLRISRSESRVDTSSGTVSTRVEVDAGPNLVETLQARLQIADQLVGF